MLQKDVWGLVVSFLPPKRSLASQMCIVAFSRVRDCLICSGYDSCPDLQTEVNTHSTILTNCRRYGACFGSRPTHQTLRQHMRLIEQLYMTLEVDDEGIRGLYAPRMPVFAFKRVRQFHSSYMWEVFDRHLHELIGC